MVCTLSELDMMRARLLKEPKQLKISFYYINNTKVARYMIENQIEYGLKYAMSGTDCGSGTDTVFWLKRSGNLPGNGPQFTPFDKVVLDSIYTLIRNGYRTATLQMITKVVYGTLDKRMNDSQLRIVRCSIDRWKQASFGINMDGEFEGRGITAPWKHAGRDKQARTDLTGYFILDESASNRNTSANGQITEGFRLEKGFLGLYAEAVGQIISIPFSTRDISRLPGSKLSSAYVCSHHETEKYLIRTITSDTIIIRDYLISRIEQMKNENSSIKSCRISYVWKDSSSGSEKGMFHCLGFDSKQYKYQHNYKHRIHILTGKILNCFITTGYIHDAEVFMKKRRHSKKPLIGGWDLTI